MKMPALGPYWTAMAAQARQKYSSSYSSLIIAAAALNEHRARSALALLGVFLGALMLTLVLHISLAVGKKVELEANRLGANVTDAAAGTSPFTRKGINRAGGRNAATLTLADAEAVRDTISQTEMVVPYTLSRRSISNGRERSACPIVGTTPQYTVIRNSRPQYGRFFTQEEMQRKDLVCVLGSEVAQRLFVDPAAASEKRVRLNGRDFAVVGVMEEKGQDATGVNTDEQVYVPITTLMQRLIKQEHISGIWSRVDSADYAQEQETILTALLRQRHHILPGQQNDFSVNFSSQVNEMQDKAMHLVFVLGCLGAGISFSVGSLGILSIMTLLVRARRMEIGIRRAVGASRKNIVRQFLLESMLLAGSGGALGVTAALLLTSVVYASGALPAAYSPAMICGVLVASISCGLLAGLYPAWQAARLSIVAALKG